VVQELELLAAEQSEEAAKLIQPMQIKPLHKVISEHKDVVKIVIQLNSIISTFKGDVQESLDVYTKYSELWNQVSYQTRLFPDASLVKASAPESRSAMQVAPLEISNS